MMISENISSYIFDDYQSFLNDSGMENGTATVSGTFREESESQTDLNDFNLQNGTILAGIDKISPGVEEKNSWKWHELNWEWWTIIQLIAAIVGILGNLLVMMVVFRGGVRRRSTDILLGTLALADFLTSVFLIPIPQVMHLPSTLSGKLYCKIVYFNTFMWTFVTVSVHILSAVSIERFIAIAFPLRFKNLFSNRLTVLYITVIIAVDAIVHFVWTFVIFVDEDTGSCVVRYSSSKLQVDVGIVLFFYKFAIPLFIMLVAQFLTAVALHTEYRRFSKTDMTINASSPQFKLIIAKRKVINMLLVVVLTFLICWGPDQIFYLLLNVGVIPFDRIYDTVNHVLIVLAFFNSCLNPFIYTARYPRFSEALADLFLGSTASKKRTPVFGPKEETSNRMPITTNDVNLVNL